MQRLKEYKNYSPLPFYVLCLNHLTKYQQICFNFPVHSQ